MDKSKTTRSSQKASPQSSKKAGYGSKMKDKLKDRKATKIRVGRK